MEHPNSAGNMTMDLPEPGELNPDGHAQMSRRFLEHARIKLAQGKRRRAAEKVWGAAAHALKAVGQQRGWQHEERLAIFDIGEQLGKEFGQAEQFYGYLAYAEYMRCNYFGIKRSPTSIRCALADIEKMVDELDTIRNSPPRPFTVTDDDDRIRLGRLLGLSREERPPIGDHSPVGYSQTH